MGLENYKCLAHRELWETELEMKAGPYDRGLGILVGRMYIYSVVIGISSRFSVRYYKQLHFRKINL